MDEKRALQEIQEFRATDHRAMLANDIDTLIGLWADDAIMFPPGAEPVEGKEAIAKRLRQSSQAHGQPQIVENTLDFNHTTLVDDWAFESGTFRSAWREEGASELSTMSGNILRVLHREPDGNWKCARAIWNLHEHPE